MDDFALPEMWHIFHTVRTLAQTFRCVNWSCSALIGLTLINKLGSWKRRMNCSELNFKKKKKKIWIWKKSQHNRCSHSLTSLIWRTYWLNTHTFQDVRKHPCSCSHTPLCSCPLEEYEARTWNAQAFVKSLMSFVLFIVKCFLCCVVVTHTL